MYQLGKAEPILWNSFSLCLQLEWTREDILSIMLESKKRGRDYFVAYIHLSVTQSNNNLGAAGILQI